MRRALPVLAALTLAPSLLAQVQVLDPLTVSATRDPEPRSQVPFTVEEVTPDAFTDTSSLTADDVLRGSPDFSLFRRNDSLTANPTSQGVSLRGLGPSGASRTLVLLDGVPLNDPFGGWVPWSMVPVDSLARAEIVPGGGASAWGNEALAGVIQLFSREPAAGTGDVLLRAGSFGTWAADLSAAVAAGSGVLSLSAEDFGTDGTVLIAPAGRGPIDIDAASRHDVETARWRGTVGAVTAAVTLRRYSEWRDNGTPYQQNDLREVFGSVDLSGPLPAHGTWDLTAYLQGQQAAQTFSSVNLARTAETPASDQFGVPATAGGVAATASFADATGGLTTVGADTRDIRGETREDYAYAAGSGTYLDQRYAGGRQDFAGLFAERSQPLGPNLHAVAGLRLDRWEDSDGHIRTQTLATGTLLSATPYPTRTGTELSPSAGLTWQATKDLRFHVAAQHAFRVPTLNELYRPFRVGNTTTLANAALATEHADTAEVGAAWSRDHLDVTLTGFGARLTNPVANVTLAQGPGTFPLFGTLPAGSLGQERLNLGRVDTLGAEFGAAWHPSAGWTLDLAVQDEQATVEAAAVAPALVGRTPPEVPRWNGSAGVTWIPLPRLSVSARVRRTSAQFDDDQNLLPLAAATVLDASARYRLSAHAEVFVTADNLADATVETAHSALGVYSVAPPRQIGGGARLSW